MPDQVFTGRINLLIVDDDPVEHERIVKSIRREKSISIDSWNISAIHAIEDLRDMIKKDELNFDCVLLDVDLGPRCTDSVFTLRDCRKFWQSAPVIVVTKHVDDDYVTAAIQAGAAGYIRKAQMGGIGLAIISALRHFAHAARVESKQVEAALVQFKKSVDGLMHDARELTRSMSQLLTERSVDLDEARVAPRRALVEEKLGHLNFWLTSYLDSFRALDKPSLPETCDVYQLARECADIILQRYGDIDISINAVSRTTVKCDRTKVARALINVMDNAAKVAPKSNLKVAVSIDFHKGADHISVCSISVRDYGPGVSDADEVLYGEYRRGDWQGSVPGFGIGLSTAKSLLGQHEVKGRRGTISYRNQEPPEAGAVFIVEFPFPA